MVHRWLLGGDWRDFNLPNHEDNWYPHNGVLPLIGGSPNEYHEGIIHVKAVQDVDYNDQEEWRVTALQTVVGKNLIGSPQKHEYWNS